MPKRKQLNTAIMRAAQTQSNFNPTNANILLATSAVFTQQLLSDLLNNSISRNLTTILADYSISVNDSKVLVDATTGNITITLPNPALSKGASYSIGKIDSTSNKVTVLPNSTELLFGETSFDLLYSNELIELVTDGTNWYIGG